jgi:hypothetical protein
MGVNVRTGARLALRNASGQELFRKSQPSDFRIAASLSVIPKGEARVKTYGMVTSSTQQEASELICGHCGESATTTEHVRQCSKLRPARVPPKSSTSTDPLAPVSGQRKGSPSPPGFTQAKVGVLKQRRSMSNDFGFASDSNSGLVHSAPAVEAGAGGRCGDCGVFVPAGSEAMHECRN